MKYYFSLLTLLLILVSLVAFTRGVILTRCILAKALYERNVPKDDLNKWVCIAQHESSFNTRAVGPTNKNRSRDWGIFQINDKYWCQPPSGNFSYNECKIDCSDLLTDDISSSVKCALKIKKQQGWIAWSTWKFCNGSLPSINDCF